MENTEPIKTDKLIRILWVPNRFSPEGRREWFVPYKATALHHYLTPEIMEYIKGLYANEVTFLSSQKGLVKTEELFEYIPLAGEEIIVTPEIKDPISIAFSIGWALTAALTASLPISTMIAVAYVVGGLVVAGALVAAGFAIYSAFQKPKTPSYGTMGGVSSGSMDAGSQTYAWDGMRTIQEVGVPVAIIYGEHRVGGNIINQYVWNDGDNEYLNLLIALGEGEIDSINDVMINDNPFENYSGLTKQERMGTNDQTAISGFEELHNIIDMGSVLLKDAPFTQTTQDNDVEAFEVQIAFVYGLYGIDNSGEMQDNFGTFKIEYKKHSDTEWIDAGSMTVTDKSRTVVKKRVKITGLDPDQYDVRITKTSDDSTIRLTSDMRWSSLDEIKNNDLAYPNTALMALVLLATNQLSGSAPNVTSIVRGIKIKTYKVMNGAVEVPYDDYYWDQGIGAFRLFSDDTILTWDGVSYSTAYCANPAWCFYDLLSNNRYGIGDFVTTSCLNLDNIAEMAKYCDERVVRGDGTYEKRFELNVVIDSAHSVLDILTQLCATFRGWVFYSQGAIRLRIDKPELPTQLFGMGNIIKDSFQQSWKSLKDVPNVIDVQFLDANNNYEQEIVASTNEASLATDPVRQKSVRVFTTSITRALREGRYALNLARYVHRSISFKASIDAIACQAGDVISISHELPDWGKSGRVVSATGIDVVLDVPVTILPGVSYKIQIRRSVDDVIEERTVINLAGSYTTITIDTAWSVTPSAYDVWCLGEINLLKKDFRIVNIKRESSSEVSIAAIEYSPLVFDDTAPDIPENNLTIPESDLPDVTDVLLTERVAKAQDGTIQNVIDVWWNKPDTSGYPFRVYKSVRIYLSSNGGTSYSFQAESSGNHAVISSGVVVGGSYRVAICTTTYSGKEKPISLSPYADIVITGKNDPPSDVTTFIGYQRENTLVFGWTAVTDLDLDSYEIRKGTNWESGELVATGLKGIYYVSDLVQVGSEQSFWIKAIDTSGNYSVTEKEAVLTVDDIPFSNVVMEWEEADDTGLSWDDFLGEETFQDVGDLRFSDMAWAGAKEDMVLNGALLEFATGVLTGKYTSLIRDVGYVAPFKISVIPVFTVAGDETWQSFGDATFQADLTRRFSGQEAAIQMTVRIRTSEDNITWGAWAPWLDADYTCRFFQLEFTFTRLSDTVQAQCSSLRYIADLPDVDDYGDGEVLDAAAGVAVSFGKTYHEIPSVSISILTGLGKVWSYVATPDLLGFTIKLYKLDGTPVTGTFSYHAHGI